MCRGRSLNSLRFQEFRLGQADKILQEAATELSEHKYTDWSNGNTYGPLDCNNTVIPAVSKGPIARLLHTDK
jgi:hypothetical protein